MIFPLQCKEVGFADQKPFGDLVYFLSRYLVKKTESGYEVLEIETEEGTGLLRKIRSVKTVADDSETYFYEKPVILQDRANLIRLSKDVFDRTKKRCTIFKGFDEHMNFVADPGPDLLLKIYVYDAQPPWPNLSKTIKKLENTGLFGELEVEFVHLIRDIHDANADVYPCRASGFGITLDEDRLSGGERIAGCLTARQFLSECYSGKEFDIENICPADRALEEKKSPYIARCCRIERCGPKTDENGTGYVVHWGASPKTIADAVFELCRLCREGCGK
ncbi:hypothetical protein J2128_002044 [Methanomicrobium sp. W14]|uniref:DUF7714 family protein n=1 Tax=Methanomicrobium sp. W14 TaxID=2817839 RepID=UPI001AE8E2DB|nr:hypothetical protein [Methanomicrobium sp. W14]MBP2134078.1 hypothetical protein [Methanomicrobium sp. W14]